MLLQVVGVSPETGEAIRSRVRNLEELKVAETKINVINIIILMIIIDDENLHNDKHYHPNHHHHNEAS